MAPFTCLVLNYKITPIASVKGVGNMLQKSDHVGKGLESLRAPRHETGSCPMPTKTPSTNFLWNLRPQNPCLDT
jgi:hypothetical protein